ncbi:hypothetical protein ACQ33O_00550 [Ferruginibacter sp. SUN002]|uniref:hypothetical protein n=1 Tax=Ferruginibacter sp. SUN002 TaxID=2937789 RepID=UPI003D35F8B4
MKKILIIFTSTILFSCKKDEATNCKKITGYMVMSGSYMIHLDDGSEITITKVEYDTGNYATGKTICN